MVGLLSDNTPTYIDKRTGTKSSLDLCLASSDLVRIGTLLRGPDLGSDHFPMIFTFGTKINKNEGKCLIRWKIHKPNWDKWKCKMIEMKTNKIVPSDATTFVLILGLTISQITDYRGVK